MWRFKSGIQTLVDTLVDSLKANEDVIKLNLNEPCERINFDGDNKIQLKTNSREEEFDVVICSSLSKSNLKKFEYLNWGFSEHKISKYKRFGYDAKRRTFAIEATAAVDNSGQYGCCKSILRQKCFASRSAYFLSASQTNSSFMFSL